MSMHYVNSIFLSGITPTEQSSDEDSNVIIVIDTKTAVLTPISQDDKLLL